MNEIEIIFEQLADAILICDEDSKIVFTNTACTKVFGYKKGDFKGMSLTSLMDMKYQPEHSACVKNFITTRAKPLDMMSRKLILCRDAKGKEFPSRISIASIQMNKRIYGVAIIHDYTSFNNELLSANLKSKVDFLTNLYNRRYLENILKPESRLLTSWKSIGVLYLDLDNFKPINDKYGHDIGDIVLYKVAQASARSLPRKTDFVARFGGEEFVALLPKTDSENAFSIAERIRTSIESLDIKFQGSSISNNVTVSIGIATLQGDALNESELLKQADTSLYLAKDAGRNCSMVYGK